VFRAPADFPGGKKGDAKKALMDIEQANMMPLFFLGGTFAYAVAPGRFDVENPFLNDPFNELTGGVALGLKQDLDLHILRDHYLKAKLEYEQALFQKRLAEDAIMADVRSRYLSADIGQKRLSIVTEGLRASRSWVSAEMNNYEFGLIPTKDVLEAFIAFAKTKLEFVDATVKYDLAVAALTRVTFRELLPLKYQGDGR
jgi:outer membrane protein TolC